MGDYGKKYLLILSCSKTKKNINGAPAIELYDGMYYRVLRKNFNLKDNKNLFHCYRVIGIFL
jgi:hypothetical protein